MPDSIRFLLNHDDRILRDLPPTTTVLEYLRLHERLTGTKEGCAEGDCGACTVMLAFPDPDGEGLSYRAVNACILTIGQLDGGQLLTVEHLKSPDGQMHPVQRAFVDCHAAQCGFCTPGFIMSVATLGEAKPAADQEDIAQAVAGNLCRCTGYRPIEDAAKQALAEGRAPWLQAAELSVRDKLDSLTRVNGLIYEAGGEVFAAPRRLDEFNALIRQYPDATILGGATDVGLWLTKLRKRLPVLIHTAHIAELQGATDHDDHIEIGGAVTWAAALPLLGAIHPSFDVMLRRFGSAQVRASGTVGGNIANGSPIGDGMPPLLALGAEIELAGPAGTRRLPLDQFYLGYRQTARRPDELVSRIHVPKLKAGEDFRVYKLSKRFDQDISAVCAAFRIQRDAAGQIIAAASGFGGMAAIPARAKAMEAALIGQQMTPAGIAGAIAALAQDFSPLTDMRASADYRRLAAANLLRRFAAELDSGGISTQVYRHG